MEGSIPGETMSLITMGGIMRITTREMMVMNTLLLLVPILMVPLPMVVWTWLGMSGSGVMTGMMRTTTKTALTGTRKVHLQGLTGYLGAVPGAALPGTFGVRTAT